MSRFKRGTRAMVSRTPRPTIREPERLQVFNNSAVPFTRFAFSNDGFVYVADRSNGRVQVFTLAGKYVNQLFPGGSPGSLALSPDKEQQFLYIGESNQILVVNRKTLAILASARFGARGTVRPHQMAIDYTAELDYGTQRFAFKGVSH